MAETLKSLLSKAKRSLASAERAGDHDVTCRHAFTAALSALRALALRNSVILSRGTLAELLCDLQIDSLGPAAATLDACALGWGGYGKPGTLTWSQETPSFELRSGQFSREHRDLALLAARQILDTAIGACA